MAKDLAVTWIAPTVESLDVLAWLDELGRITRIGGVKVTTCTGTKVLRDDVAATLNIPADVVVWSGHGVAGGLLASDMEILRPKWLASQISLGARPSIAILAACDSQARDNKLRSLTEAVCRQGTNVIGFPARADDLDAARFTVEYIRALKLGMSVSDAFDVAMEEIADEETALGVMLTPGLVDVPFDLPRQLTEILALLTKLDQAGQRSRPGAEKGEHQSAALSAEVGSIQSLTRKTRGPRKESTGHINGITKFSS